LIREFNGKRYYHIGFKVACDYLGVNEKDIHLYPKRFIELKNTKVGDIRIPIDEENRRGEEFVLMLPNTDLPGAKMLAGRIRESVQKHTFIDNYNRSYRVNVSLGVAELDEKDIRDILINKADTALYLAKRTGRNKVCD